MHTAKHEEELILYSYGELEGDELKAFEAHLASCPDCSGKLATLRAAGTALKDAQVNPPRWIVENVEREAAGKFRFTFKYVFRTLTPVAAAVAMAALLILPQGEPQQAAQTAHWNDVSDTALTELHTQLETARYDIEYGTDYVTEFEIKAAGVEGRIPAQNKESKS